MNRELIHFRDYAKEVLSDRFMGKTVSVDEVSTHDRQGNFYYRVYAWIDNKLCIGTGQSQGKALDDAMASFADYHADYERVSIG